MRNLGWEFNCRCWLEEITAKEAGKEPDLIQEKTPADKVTVDSRSGFSFDPEHVFEEFDMSSMKTEQGREEVHDEIVEFCKKENCSMTLNGSYNEEKLNLNQQTYREPENIEEIKAIFQKVEKRKTEPIEEFSISVGKILPEHVDKLGLTDFKDDIIFKYEENDKRVGVTHWERNHDDTLNLADAIRLFRMTIWNPNAKVKEDIYGNRRRICIYVTDKEIGSLSNVWVIKDNGGKLILELVDSWYPDIRYIKNLGSKHKKKHPDRS